MQTMQEIRAEIEAAKVKAMARFAADYGPNALAGLADVRKNNAKALDAICAVLRK